MKKRPTAMFLRDLSFYFARQYVYRCIAAKTIVMKPAHVTAGQKTWPIFISKIVSPIAASIIPIINIKIIIIFTPF